MPAESREARTAGIVVLATLAVLGARLLAVPLLATLKIKGDHTIRWRRRRSSSEFLRD